MNEHTFISISFILFLLTFALSYKMLYKKKFYNWKINLIFTVSYMTFIIGTVILLSYTSNFKVMIMIGSVMVPPFTTYQVSSSKYFIDKNRNTHKIILKNKGE